MESSSPRNDAGIVKNSEGLANAHTPRCAIVGDSVRKDPLRNLKAPGDHGVILPGPCTTYRHAQGDRTTTLSGGASQTVVVPRNTRKFMRDAPGS